MKKLFFWIKPSIKASMFNKGQNVKVRLVRIDNSNAIAILYFAIRQTSLLLKVDTGHLMNRLHDLSKKLERDMIKEAKAAKKAQK